MLDQATAPQTFPLRCLSPDPLNPRHEIDPEGTAALAESIRAIGLIQPLAGRMLPVQEGDAGPSVGIVAGGRRLAALQLLGDPDLMVPVVIAPDDATAEAWATADPVTHRALHPADEIRAYGRAAKSQPVPRIAAAFGVTEKHVKRRLALASLPGAALDALKAGEISLSAAEVLTTAKTEADALQALDAGRGRDFRREWWQRSLHPKSVAATDRRIVFVGAEAYAAEGGEMTLDLFSDSAVVHDEAMLDKVFARVLKARAREIGEAEGWGQVLTVTTSWFAPSEHGKAEVPPKDGLPEGDMSRLNRLQQTPGRTAAEEDERKDLTARYWVAAYPAKTRKKLGATFYVDRHGTLCKNVWKDAKPAKRAADDNSPDAEADADGVTVSNPNPAAEAALSQALKDELRAIRHATLQTALLGRPELLRDLLAWSVSGALAAWHQPLAITLTSQPAPPQGEDAMRLDPRLASPERGHGAAEPAAFAAFQARQQTEREAVLIAALAGSLNHLSGPFADWLLTETDARPRDLWTPTRANFFGRLKGAMLDAIWAELFAGVHEDKDAAWAKLKTRDKAAELDALFNSADHREAWGMSRDLALTVDGWMPVIA